MGILQVITRSLYILFVIWILDHFQIKRSLKCNDHVMSWDFAASAGAAIAMTREVEDEIAEVILVKQ